jgi:integrase
VTESRVSADRRAGQRKENRNSYKAALGEVEPDAYVFPGQNGRRDRNAVLRRVLRPTIKRANEALRKAGRASISPAVTFHSLRRTYASLMAEAGVDPAYTAAQIGHRSARFTLDVYTDVGRRRLGANERLDALIRGEQWAPMGTNGETGKEENGNAADAKLEEAAPQGEI